MTQNNSEKTSKTESTLETQAAETQPLDTLRPEINKPNNKSIDSALAAQMAGEISQSMLRLRMRSPFFATLALFARFVPLYDIPTAATDGKDVFYNPKFMAGLTAPERDGVMLHEVLHAALAHVSRRGTRNGERWNIAADVVVNGVLLENGFVLPQGHIRDEDLEKLSVEEVFAALPKDAKMQMPQDLMESSGDGKNQDGEGNDKQRPSRQLTEAEARNLEQHWRKATQQAATIARGTQQGKLPAGIERTFGLVGEPRLDWRTLLWRFLTRTPTDFSGFDRRHVHSGLYLETLEGESIKLFVCVDTSGSIDEAQVNIFLDEVRGILQAYPQLSGQLYYADAAVYGPHNLFEPSTPQGGGGTDFRPFFETVQEQTRQMDAGGAVCVYLTDGFGDFPETPDVPTLWVVTSGGLANELFPFGEVARFMD